MPNTTEIRGNVTEEINKKIEQLKADRPERRKEVTVSFIVEDYFTLIAKIKASIKEAKGSACSYSKEERLKCLEELL